MKRALMYASVASMIQQFNMNNIQILLDLGYEVDVACNFETGSTISNEKIKELKNILDNLRVRYYQIDVPRQITDTSNIKKAYKQTLKLMNERNYSLIHCHSPIGGVICRIANKNSTNYKNVRMIYTAHGFHFFKGNNLIKNILFRNIERYAARYTDVLITINQEDYQAAKSFALKNGGVVEYVPGIGIDVKKIQSIHGDKKELCNELGINEDSIILISVGELSDRKNQKVIIQGMNDLPKNYHYVICGKGSKLSELRKLSVDLKVSDRVHFLGFRTDIIKLVKSSDMFVFPSLQEGLPVALMEALASGIPCIASKIRGNTDLITDSCGSLIDKNESWSTRILEMGNRRKDQFWKQKNMLMYDVSEINNKIRQIYLNKE